MVFQKEVPASRRGRSTKFVINTLPERQSDASGLRAELMNPVPGAASNISEVAHKDTGHENSNPSSGENETVQHFAIDLISALAQAKEYISIGRKDDATVILKEAVRKEPNAAAALIQLGTIEYQSGDYTAAAVHLQKAIEIDPRSVDPKLILVRVAMREGRIEEACSIAADIESTAPDNPRALATAAKAYVKAHRFGDAANIWRKVVDLTPNDPMVWAEIARTELRARSPETALQAAEHALALDPACAVAHTVRIESLKRCRKLEELAQAALEAADIDPTSAASTIQILRKPFPLHAAAVAAAVRKRGEQVPEAEAEALARDLLRRGRAETSTNPDAAMATWKALLAVDPDNRQAQSAIRKFVAPLLASSRAKSAAGDIQGAIADSQTLLELGGDRTKILRDLAALHEKAANWPDAARCWAEAAKAEDRRDRFIRAARNATKAEMLLEALQYYQEAYKGELSSEQAQSAIRTIKVRLQRAMRDQFESGNLEDAGKGAQVILGIDPGNDTATTMLRKIAGRYVRLIRRAVDLGDLEGQEKLSRDLLALDGGHTVALRILLRIYAVQKRRGECLEIIDRLVEIEPDDSSHWEKKARICRSIRKYDQGIPAALKALELDPGNRAVVGYLNDMLRRQAAAA